MNQAEMLKKRLVSGLSQYYSDLMAAFPSLLQIQTTPDLPHVDRILLPSVLSFSPAQIAESGIQELLKAESELRVGHAFDCLQKLRQSLGVRSFLSRHSRQAHGHSNNTRAQATIKRAEGQVNLWANIYRRTYSALQKMNVSSEDLLGLQELKDDHLKMLSSWLEEEQYRKTRESTLPWLWTIAPLNSDEDDSTVSEKITKWNEEGNVTLMELNINIISEVHTL